MTPQELASLIRRRASVIRTMAETLSIKYGGIEMPSSLAAAGELDGLAERLEALPQSHTAQQFEDAVLGRG